MFHLTTGLIGLFVATRFFWPLPWPITVRVLIGLAVLLVSQHHLANRMVFGTMFSPEVPRAVIIVVNGLFGAMLMLALFQVVLDIGTIVAALVRQGWRPAPVGIRYAMGAAALLLGAFGVQQATRVPPVKEIEVAIRDLPPAFDGFRMVQLTDLHLSRLFQAPWAQAVVDRTNALAPDLIVITGDLIDGTMEARRDDIAPLAGLRAPEGVFTVTGNHEYYFGQPEWMQAYRDLGMTVLENAHVVLRREGAEVVLAGVTDRTAIGRGLPAPDLAQALAGAPDAPVILMDHQPLMARDNARGGADLQLSGHTHGGMVLGLDRLIARYNNGFVSGAYDVDGMPLYVNNGTALWPGFALRLGKPSELTVITLRRAER